MTLDRTIAPPIKDAIEFNLLLKPYRQFNLNNGAPVYYLNDGTEEVGGYQGRMQQDIC